MNYCRPVAVYMLLIVYGLLGLQAVIGLSHRRYRLLVKVFPCSESHQYDVGPEVEPLSHHQRMQEFRLL